MPEGILYVTFALEKEVLHLCGLENEWILLDAHTPPRYTVMLSVSVGAFSSVTYPDHPAPNTLEMFEVITTLADTEKRNFAHNHDSPTSHIIFIFKILSYSHPDAHIIPT